MCWKQVSSCHWNPRKKWIVKGNTGGYVCQAFVRRAAAAGESTESRNHDGGKEQQDAAAHRLPHAVHPAGRPRLHRHLQGLR